MLLEELSYNSIYVLNKLQYVLTRPSCSTFSICLTQVLTMDKIASEVKLQLAGDVILRYDGGRLVWTSWLPGPERFADLAVSNIRIGDAAYTRIVLCMSPEGVSVFENGTWVANYERNDRSPLSVVKPTFDWQVLEGENELSATFWRILVVPSLYGTGFNTPWTISLSSQNPQQNDVWSVDKEMADAIPVTYHAEGFMRASTSSLTKWNSWVYPELRTPLPSNGVVIYRMRVNASSGSESKVTVLGENILRITDNGNRVEWTWYNEQGAFIKLSDSFIQVGKSEWVTVMVVFNSTNVAVLENGVYRFRRTFPTRRDFNAVFHVQHLDVGTEVSVDLSHVRALPFRKTAVNHVRDMGPFLLAYYPLKGSIAEDSKDLPSLNLLPTSGYQPSYCAGAFGPAVQFRGLPGALEFPIFPYRKILPSYTLALWVKLDKYPVSGQLAGIAGPLMVDSDGRLHYEFVDRQYGKPQRQLSSDTHLQQGQWYSIIVSYSFEQSRLSLYVGGYLDSIIYIEADGSSQQAVLPLHGNIGAGYDPSSQNLNGAVGDIMFFSQHIHEATALSLANQHVESAYSDDPRKRLGPLLLLIPAIYVIGSLVVLQVVANRHDQDGSPDQPNKQSDPMLEWTKNINSLIDQRSGGSNGAMPKISRADVGIPDEEVIGIDVGGEGPVVRQGVLCGFPGAFNLNSIDVSPGFNGSPSLPIPYLIKIPDWSTKPPYPFADNFADKMYMQSAPFDDHNATEFARVIKPNGEISLWVDDERYEEQIDRLVRETKGVRSKRGPDDYSSVAAWVPCVIVANKGANTNKDELR